MLGTNLKTNILRVRNGDKDAFAQIYNELKQPVFTLVYRIVQSRETAEDVTQDIFVKLFISPPNASVQNPRAWIFQIARNAAIDTLRKTQALDLDDRELAAEDALNAVLLRWDIESAISKLSREEREILSLHINAELRFHEISRIVGLSLSATYRKYRKALKTLQEYLNGGSL